jgi:hypothetical protein
VDSPLHPHRHRRRWLMRGRLHPLPWTSIWRHHHRHRPLQRQLLVVHHLRRHPWSLGLSLPVVGSPLAPSMLRADASSSLVTTQMGWDHLPPPIGGPNGPRCGRHVGRLGRGRGSDRGATPARARKERCCMDKVGPARFGSRRGWLSNWLARTPDAAATGLGSRPYWHGHGVAMATLCVGEGGPTRTRMPRRGRLRSGEGAHQCARRGNQASARRGPTGALGAAPPRALGATGTRRGVSGQGAHGPASRRGRSTLDRNGRRRTRRGWEPLAAGTLPGGGGYRAVRVENPSRPI